MSKMHSHSSLDRSNPARVAPKPSRRLTRAAVSGLLGLSAVGCGDDDSSHDDEHGDLSDEELTALCQGKVDDALAEAEASQDLDKQCKDVVDDAVKTAETAAAADVKTAEDALMAAKDACPQLLLTDADKEISSEQKEYTFDEITELCDERGGYTQIHAACGGHNACAGFSYADWGPGGATLFEHACAGANACNGLSCVVLPEDAGMTGKDVYEFDDYADPGPNSCISCHATWEEDDKGESVPDVTKFKVWVYAGSTRDEDNWLDRTKAEQERSVAFGARSVLPDGTAVDTMAPYHRQLSRAEIERVVEHIRTLDPVISEVKTQDP